VFAKLPRAAHPKIKAWPSRLGIEHQADNLILEEMIMLRTPKREAKAKLNVLNKKKKKKKRKKNVV
jgi:hypothetical protein